MKKLILLFLCSIFLVACSETDKERVNIELEFIELQNEDERPKAIFVSNEEQRYYEIKITAYEYNNWELSKGDTIQITRDAEGNLDSLFTRYSVYYATWDSKDIIIKQIDYFEDKNQ